MKRFFTLFALSLLCVVQSLAYDAYIDGIYYNLDKSKGTAEVTCVYNLSDDNWATYVGNVVIPNNVEYDGNSYNVTSIGTSAFYNCSNLFSITIPEGVTTIASYAFYHCWNLSSIDIPEGVTTIGEHAFSECQSLSSITIPEGVTTIEEEAFYKCYSLSSIEMPPSVTFIGENAFGRCSSLSSIYIKDVTTWCNIEGLSGLADSGASSKTLYVNGEVAKDVIIEEGATSIPNYAFQNFRHIQHVSIPSSVTSIGYRAFYSCSSLSSIEILEGVVLIGDQAFKECSSLSSIEMPKGVNSIGNSAFENCSSLESIEIPLSVTSIGYSAFYGCSTLSSIKIPKGVTSIGDRTFYKCFSLSSVEIPNGVTRIGEYAFYECSALWKVKMEGSTPPAVFRSTFEIEILPSFVVPDAAYDDYTATWPDYAGQITIASQCEREVTITAQDAESAIHKAVGEENLRHVLSLRVNGSINGYDIMIMRNKMINLRHLDLSNASIVGNDYEYYTGYHTSDNEIGPYAFYNLPNLFCVKLPEVTAIRQYAFAINSNLREINLPESLTTLAYNSFENCRSLPSIEIPGGVKTIGSYAFSGCSALKTLTLNEGLIEIGKATFDGCKITDIRFPESLTTIGYYAFRGNSFEEVNLPPNLNTIEGYAFLSCPNLNVVRLNPMLKNISNSAFSSCNALKKVYTYTLEPTDIQQNTFSAYKTADLYVPTPSYYTYYYNTQWSQFLSVNKTDEEYDFKSFYITKDYEMDDNTGILGGDPDAELNENSGLINSGSETQELGTVTMRFNGNNGSASIIANGNLTAEKIKVEITVTGNKWHFFCFPFDVPLSGVHSSGNKAYVFRHYNAEKRAAGASGWENLPSDQEVLKAGEGYIFQANGNTTLTVEVDNKTTFVGENVAAALKVQDAANVANASWNFKGNPGYAYFDIDDLGFTAPITVWDPNTNNYVALRPGDDDAFLHPFQAFFVQKPEGTDALTFNAEDRTTYHGSQKKMAKKVAHRRAKADADNPRKLINLVLTDGQTTDKTRVVFNDEKSMAYEMECDAAKFASTGVPQLYSLDGNNTHYSINERPYGDGTVRLGFTADKAGRFAIEAQRMDANCYLRDLENGVTHDLRMGAYEFESKAGTFESRFMLVNADVTDGLKSVNVDEVAKDAVIYDLQGRRVQHAQRGVFIINGKKLNVK